jgi:hypothetical protein
VDARLAAEREAVSQTDPEHAAMVTLRPTQKLRAALPVTEMSAAPDTALGDWYVKRLVVDRRPLLLLVSSSSLLPMLVPARDVRGLPGRLVDLVASRLFRLGVRASLIDAETKAMSPIRIGVTIDRSVVGIMIDFAKGVPYYLEAGRWDDPSLAVVEDRLAKTPCHASKPWEQVVFPDRKAPELLAAKWAG